MLSSIWNDFMRLQEAEKEKNPIFVSLLRQITPIDLTEKTMTFACESIGAKKYLDKKKFELETLLANHLKKKIAVEFVTEQKENIKKEQPLFSFEPSKEDAYVRAGLNSKYQFENFAVSSTNQVAFAAAQSVAKNPGHSYNPLFLYGGVGVGKTHLAQSVAREVLENDPTKKAFFCPGDQFINELIEAIREKATLKFRKKYRYLNVLIVDDIQFIAGKQTIQEEFFHTFNSIVSAGGQIILTSDRPPSEIKNLEDRLRSRFSGGLIVDIQPPDFELRTAILLIKAKEKNIQIDMQSARAIAEAVTDSRALEGTLLSLYAKIVDKKEAIDLETVEELFQEKRRTPVARKITPVQVIKTVCSYYNVKQSHIKSATRTNEIAQARQIIMYILRTELQLKLEEVSYILKRKDHTTVMHGTDKIKRMMMKDPLFKQDIDSIISSLRSST